MKLRAPQRGQIWRRKFGTTFEVLDDRRVGGKWAVLVTAADGVQWIAPRDLHDGTYEPPRPEVPTFWVNAYADIVAPVARSNPIRTDDKAGAGRICRVPLIPDWDGAVYDEEAT